MAVTAASNGGPIEDDQVFEAVEGAEAVAPLSPGGFARALVDVALHGDRLGRRTARLGVEAAKIAAGRSEIKPEKGDWRFKDDAWASNFAYRRLMQLYLAWADSVMDAVDESKLEWRRANRARFCLEVLTTAVSPTNTLPGNPAALKHVFDTAGVSLLRGARNVVDDALTNKGMPRQVPRNAYELGSDLAASPGAVVYRDDFFELLQFTPTSSSVFSRPVVMVPPQINKYYFMDLAPGRSFIEHAVGRGIPFFAISWRNPTKEQSQWGMDDYAEGVLRAVDVAREVTKSDDVNLLSLCAGGMLSAGVLSHLAQSNDDRVNSASFGVTLLDFGVPAPIGMFQMDPVLSFARNRSTRAGVLDGRSLGAVFNWMRPNDLVWNYWVNNYLLGESPPTFDILAWNSDSTNLPGRLHSEFLDIFQNNYMAKQGEFEVLGTPVDLERVSIDTYVTGATKDHLTPWKGCYRTTQLMSGGSTFILSNAGHIASLINPPGNPKAHYFAGPEPGEEPEKWLASAEQHQGTWWEHWADWVLERSGPEKRAPGKPGSKRHQPIESAPGQYVRG